MTGTQELKPCPHCGHDAALIHIPHARPFVECKGRPAYDTMKGIGIECGARTGYYSTEAEAITAWNTRQSTTPSVDAEVVELALHLIDSVKTESDMNGLISATLLSDAAELEAEIAKLGSSQ